MDQYAFAYFDDVILKGRNLDVQALTRSIEADKFAFVKQSFRYL